MHLVIFACLLLLIATTVLHYEVLRGLNRTLPCLPVPHRLKLLVVIFGAFFAHAVEIVFYGVTLYVLVRWLHVGQLVGAAGFSFASWPGWRRSTACC